MCRVSFIFHSSLFLLLVPQIVYSQDSPAPATEWISPDALIVVEITRPDAILDAAFQDDVVKAVTAIPAYKDLMANSEAQQAFNLVNYFKGRFECDLPTLIDKVVGGGITWAIGPNEANLLIIEAKDAKTIEEIHEFFLMNARNDAEKAGQPDRVASAEYRGVTGWRFGPNEAHAIVGNRLLVTNKPDMLKLAMDLRAEPDQPCFADSESFQEAKRASSQESVATVYANMGVLKQIPKLQKGLSENENPLASLLFAPLQKSLRNANWVSIAAEIQDGAVQFQLTTDGTVGDPSAADGFALPEVAGEGAMPNFDVPQQIAGISLYRDLYRYYAAKDELFPERTSGLIFFENMMGIFFTGRDLTDEVLAETRPEIRVVVAEQRYDSNVGTPSLQLPGFAVVMRMRDPDKFAPIVEEAWQKAIGLVNFTRGQQAEPGLIIERPTHADITYTKAGFSAADEQDRASVNPRHNFQPTLAMPGDYLILGSCDTLTRDLIDAIGDHGDVDAMTDTHSIAVIDGPQLASILEKNSDAMVRQNMVEDGNTREEAEMQQRILRTVLQNVRTATLHANSTNGQSQLIVRFELSLPVSVR
ncbi:hypothetical protein CA13_15810 [Planctomycetes bacterium CA13]|uniref:DUF3352 domain-containing protein n=1 Tax=Novipirellula herctigrandis TaxID=2527986 RepID=A0A5C5YYJ3_9BACT|nr:hypothetical protein CA13_15810 [Planctomycetes bacterium CA13]